MNNLDGLTIYNYNEAFTGRGIDQFELLLSNDNFFSDIRSGGIFDLDAASRDAFNPGQAFLIDEIAQFVRFDIISNINGSNFSTGSLNNVAFNFMGLIEVEFFGTVAAVPEPTTITLWSLLGIGLVSYRRWRRR